MSGGGANAAERPVSALRLPWAVGYAVAAVAIATAAAWPIYQHPRAVLVGVAGGAAGIGLAVLGARLRWRWWMRALVLVAAYLIVAVPLAVPSALSPLSRIPRGLLDAVVGVVAGWKQVVTVDPPLGDYQAVLVPLLLVVLGGGFLVATLALLRHPAGAAASGVAVAMLVFGIAFGSDSAPVELGSWALPDGRSVLLAIALMAVTIVWLVGRARITRAEARALARSTASPGLSVVAAGASAAKAARRGALGVGIVAGALVVGLAAAPALAAAGSRQVLRDAVDPALVIARIVSPLSGYRSWYTAERFDATVLTVDTVPAGIDRLRLATLSEYDGTRFMVGVGQGDRFARLANPATPAGAAPMEVTIGEAYAGIWVPVPAVMAAAPRFTGDRAALLADGLYVAADNATAVAITDAAGAGLLPGDRYTVWAGASPDTARLAQSVGGEVMIDPDRLPELAAWVDDQDVERTGAGLLELVERLRERGLLSHARSDDAEAASWIAALKSRGDYLFEPSLAGHSIARVESLFSALIDRQRQVGDADDALLVAAVGDDEQFATAVALLARYLGFESRVVIGVLLASDDPVPSVAPCARGVCTGANVTAWAEVRDAEGQWVALDATPQFTLPASRVTVSEIPPEQPTVPGEARSDVVEPPSARAFDEEVRATPDPPAPAWLDTLLAVGRVVGAASLALLLALLPPIVLAAAKALRRRGRRRQPDPEVAVVGAWEELVDLYVDRGYDPVLTMTRQSTALAVRRPAAEELAELADRAVFAGHPPTDEAREEAWGIVRRERAEIAAASGLTERIRTALSLRSFARRLRLPAASGTIESGKGGT